MLICKVQFIVYSANSDTLTQISSWYCRLPDL